MLEPCVLQSNFNLFSSTTSRTTSSSSSRNARTTPVLVIRPPAQPPLSQEDWEPPSALGVCSPEGFKSERSISEFRPYTPSPSVSTFAPSSVTSSTVSTPRIEHPLKREISEVLQRATEALALHAQRSLDSITSESAYSDPGTAPESFDGAEEEDEYEPRKASEVDLTSKPLELPALSESAAESLQVERPLSPVAVELAASSSSSSISSHDHIQPTIRPSLLGFLSRWAEKRPPSPRGQKDKQPESSAGPNSAVRYDSTTSSTSPFTRLKNKSTDKLASLLGGGEVLKSSSSSVRSLKFKRPKFRGRRTNSASLPQTSRAISGPVSLPTSQPIYSASPSSSPTPATRTVLVADNDLPPEVGSVRSVEKRRAIESQSSAVASNKVSARPLSYEEPIGGEPVLISSELQSDSERDPVPSILPGAAQLSAEDSPRSLPTPPRSRSPSIFGKKLGERRTRTGSLRDLLKRSDPTKNNKSERVTPSIPTFLSWITMHSSRSHSQIKPSLPTPLATPDLGPLVETATPAQTASPVNPTSPISPTSPASRILSLVWYPPELIHSPYASDISLEDARALNSIPPGDLEHGLSSGPASTHEHTDTSSHPHNSYSFHHRDSSHGTNRMTNHSSSTIHAATISSGRRTPAKLRRRRPGSKAKPPRTPPTSYTALARKQSRGREGSAESVIGNSPAPESSAPSQSLDTLLNSAWPEPPIDQPVGEEGQGQMYNYHSETGGEEDLDQEEYLSSPTSIRGNSRPTTPRHSRARSRSGSPGHAIREQRIIPPVIHTVLGDQPDWDADSGVTSYLSTSPTIKSHPSPAIRSPPVPPLPQHFVSRAGQNNGNAGTARPLALLPLRSESPAPIPAAGPSSATPPAHVSPPPTRGTSPTPRASPKPRVPATAPILRSPAVPRRSTSYHSAASLLQSPRRSSLEDNCSARPPAEERRPSVDTNRSIPLPFDDRRSITSSLHSKRRSPTQRRARRDSNSNRSHRESIRSHRDSLILRKDSLQAQRRDSIQSRRESVKRRDSNSASSHRDQISSDNQIWAVPRNHRQRPTICFEFPPTDEFWRFLNEYQKFCNSGVANPDDSGYGTLGVGVNMSERRSGSATPASTSKSSKLSKSPVDPVKDWHKVQPSSSRSSSARTSTPYVPTTDVVERNELIVRALKNAPGALNTRFRHFGQLGVLGWSSEFSELVDEIQRCGLERQMFTTTREQALATCKALLKMHMEIRLQMITMFLCSQIARLRRFLDAETEYTDYPTPDFPLPQAY